MNITVERLPECKVRLSAEIPAESVASTRREIVSAFSRQAKVPGFRPGKIPISVIEKRFADSIDGELKDRLARSAYAEARTSKSIAILGIAQVERDEIDAEGTYRLDVEVVTEPEVEIPEYEGLVVEVPKMEVREEDIDGFLLSSRRNRSTKTAVDRAAAPGDVVVISYTGTIDGLPVAEQVEGEPGPIAGDENHSVTLPLEGEPPRHFIPGLAEALVGMSGGEKKTHEAVFPDDFPMENIAGKTIRYEISVGEVLEVEVPELDDSFAASFGVSSVEELREGVRAQFEHQRQQTRVQVIDNQILGKLSQDASFELPAHIVFNETQNQVNRMVARGYEQGMSHEDIEQQQEDLIRSAEQQARNNVKVMFLLDQIAEKEGITASDQEVVDHIGRLAQQHGRPVKKVFRELRESDGIERARHDIRISKTVAFLREHAEVKEIDPPADGGAAAEPPAAEEAPQAAAE